MRERVTLNGLYHNRIWGYAIAGTSASPEHRLMFVTDAAKFAREGGQHWRNILSDRPGEPRVVGAWLLVWSEGKVV